MKRLLLLLIAAGGAAFWWNRRGSAYPDLPLVSDNSSWTPVTSTSTSDEQPKLGGDVDAELLEILACPSDKQSVKREGNYLVCVECQRHYPIRDGIPVMLIDEALTPEQARAQRV